MRVIAIKPGYDGQVVRDPEALIDGKPVVFEMPDGARGTWFVPVDAEGNPQAPVPKKPDPKVVPGAGPAKPKVKASDSVTGAGPAKPPGTDPKDLA